MTIPLAIEHAELALHALRQAETSAGTRAQQLEGAMRELVMALSAAVEAERERHNRTPRLTPIAASQEYPIRSTPCP